MKQLIYLLLVACLNLTANAQVLRWGAHWGGTNEEFADALTADKEGNIIYATEYSNSLDVDPGPGVSMISGNYSNLLLIKLSKNGNLIWAKSFGSSNYIDRIEDMTVDNSGNIYVTGYFGNTCDFDPGPGVSSVTAVGEGDIFIEKLDSAGNFIWVRTMGGADWERGFGIGLDSIGNIYVTGKFEGTCDFDPGLGVDTLSTSLETIYIQKLDSNGDFLWAKKFEGNNYVGGSFTSSYLKMKVSAAGHMYICGQFEGTLDVDPGQDTLFFTSAAPDQDVFVAEFDTDGDLLWASQVSGPKVYCNDIDLDDQKNIYISGGFKGTTDFDPGPASHILLAGGNDGNGFVQKLDSIGNLVWVSQFSSTRYSFCRSLVVDDDHQVYVAGGYYDDLSIFNSIGSVTYTGYGYVDAFAAKLNDQGKMLWARQFGGTSEDRGLLIDLAPLNQVIVGGYFKETAELDAGTPNLSYTAAGQHDIYLFSFSRDSTIVVDTVINDTTGIYTLADNSMMCIYPNPTNQNITINLGQVQQNVTVSITDLTGRMIREEEYQNSQYLQTQINGPAGMYFIRISSNGQQQVLKVIKE